MYITVTLCTLNNFFNMDYIFIFKKHNSDDKHVYVIVICLFMSKLYFMLNSCSLAMSYVYILSVYSIQYLSCTTPILNEACVCICSFPFLVESLIRVMY